MVVHFSYFLSMPIFYSTPKHPYFEIVIQKLFFKNFSIDKQTLLCYGRIESFPQTSKPKPPRGKHEKTNFLEPLTESFRRPHGVTL